MKTFEMMKQANNNGYRYKINQLFYSSELGFHNSKGSPWPGVAYDNLNNLFEEDEWEIDNDIEHLIKREIEYQNQVNARVERRDIKKVLDLMLNLSEKIK